MTHPDFMSRHALSQQPAKMPHLAEGGDSVRLVESQNFSVEEVQGRNMIRNNNVLIYFWEMLRRAYSLIRHRERIAAESHSEDE